MISKRTQVVLGLALMFLLAGAMPSAPDAAPQNMVLGTAPAGTSSFPYMVGVATIVNKALPDKFALSPQETGGSVANIRLLEAGKIHLTGFSGMVAADAVEGKGPFKGTKYHPKVLFSMYGQHFHWFARKASGITSWEKVAGHSMAVGTPGGSTRVAGDLVVQAKGLKGKAKFVYLRPGSMLDSMRDGNLDAGFGLATGNALAPWVQEALATLKINVFGLDDATIDKIVKSKKGLTRYEFQADFFEKGSKAFSTFSEYLIAGVSSKMDNESAYLLTKTVQDHLADLAKYSPAAKGVKPGDALNGVPGNLSFHPGAIRYYKEKGVMK